MYKHTLSISFITELKKNNRSYKARLPVTVYY